MPMAEYLQGKRIVKMCVRVCVCVWLSVCLSLCRFGCHRARACACTWSRMRGCMHIALRMVGYMRTQMHLDMDIYKWPSMEWSPNKLMPIQLRRQGRPPTSMPTILALNSIVP